MILRIVQIFSTGNTHQNNQNGKYFKTKYSFQSVVAYSFNFKIPGKILYLYSCLVNFNTYPYKKWHKSFFIRHNFFIKLKFFYRFIITITK